VFTFRLVGSEALFLKIAATAEFGVLDIELELAEFGNFFRVGEDGEHLTRSDRRPIDAE